MPTLSVNSNAGVIRGLYAGTTETLRITILDPDGVAKSVGAYAFRCTYRLADNGRIFKTWNTSSGGGITIQSGPSGRIEVAVSNIHAVPVSLSGIMEVTEYSGGSLSGPPTDRFRFGVPVTGGHGASY